MKATVRKTGETYGVFMGDKEVADGHGFTSVRAAEAVAAFYNKCKHENTVEGVDEDGNLVEPAYDVCVDCGLRID